MATPIKPTPRPASGGRYRRVNGELSLVQRPTADNPGKTAKRRLAEQQARRAKAGKEND